jgi:predicted enzyme related to lactoylglutathione lyase
MNQDTNSVNWFEIPVTDMARAKHFYQVAFGIHMEEETMMNIQLAYFPNQPCSGKVAGPSPKAIFISPRIMAP